MTREVIQASQSASVKSVAQLMNQHQVSCVVITEQHPEIGAIPVGIITERDIVQVQALQLKLSTITAQVVMSSPPFSLSPDDILWKAHTLMEKKRIRHLVITGQKGELQGLITQTSILQVLDPLALLNVVSLLQNKVNSLEAEKMELLERKNAELEKQVSKRTAELEKQSQFDRLLGEINQRIRESLELETILNTAVEELRKILDTDRVIIYRFNPDWSGEVSVESVKEEKWAILGRKFNDPCFEQSWAQRYQQGRILAVADIKCSELNPCYVEFLETIDVKGQIVVPLLQGKKLLGLLIIYSCAAVRDWLDQEILLVQKVSIQLAIAIEQAELYKQAQIELKKRQKQKIKLKESEAKLNNAQRMAKIGHWDLDLVNNNFILSDELVRICEIDAQQFQPSYQGFLAVVHPDDRELIDQTYTNSLKLRQPYSIEHRLLMRDGRIKYVWEQCETDYDAQGKPLISRGTMQDITERKETEITLQNLIKATAAVTGENFFAEIVYHLAQILKVTYVSVAQVKENGFEVIAYWQNQEHQLKTIIPDSQVNSCQPNILENKICENNFCNKRQLENIEPENTSRDALEAESCLGIFLYNSKKEIIGKICVINHCYIENIQQAKGIMATFAARAGAELERLQLNAELEERVKQRTLELQEREEELQDFLDNANDLIQSVSLIDGSFIYVNRAWRETLGYTEKEVQEITIFDVLTPNCQEHCQQAIAQMTAGVIDKMENIELTFLTKNKQEVIVEGSVNCRYQNNQPIATRAIFRDITRRKQAELELRESKEFLQVILDSIPQRIFWKDRQYRFLGCNQNFADDANLNSPEEIIGKNDFDFSWRKWAENFQRYDREVIENDQPKINYEEIIMREPNNLSWLLKSKIPLHNLDGEVIGVLGVYEDITERKQAEEIFQQQLEAIEAAIDGIAVLKKDVYIYLNQAHISMFGYEDKTELLGKSWKMLYSPEEIQSFREEVFPILFKEKHWQGEATATRKDGSTFAEGLSLTLLEDGTLICVCRDNTEKKQAEIKLHQLKERLALSLKSGAIGYWDWDAVNNVLTWDERMYELYGIKSSDFTGNYLDWAERLHPEDRTDAEMAIQKALEGEKEYDIEFRVVHPDGSIRYIKASALVQRNEKGEPQQIIGINFDITESKRIQENLKQAKEAAEMASRAKSEFLAMMSHEIRTPMNAILGFTHLALQTKLNEQQQDYLEKIKISANSLLQIINDILDFSKIEANKLELEKSNFKLEKVLGNINSIIGLLAEEKGVKLSFKTAPEIPTLLIGDSQRLAQILMNLANNAVKFTEQGEIVITTEKIAQTEDLVTLKFTVKDTGIGITSQQIKKLFQPFSQADSSTTRKHGGTGLGLVISKRLVEMMNGRIWVESELGKGSEFKFEIELGWGIEKPVNQSVIDITSLKGTKCLVIDDNPANNQFMQKALESFAFRVTTAASGEEALEKIAAAPHIDPYKLIIVDWLMPKMNGIETIKKIQENYGSQYDVKILMITAYKSEKINDLAKVYGVNYILDKPINIDKIKATIIQLFDHGSLPKKLVTNEEKIKEISGGKILLVEDNKINQQIAQELLKIVGIDVEVANDGNEAINWVKNQRFDLILMDIRMPNLDGLTATRQLRSMAKKGDVTTEYFATVPIIAMTANAMSGDKEECLAAGMNDYIAKPIEPEKLYAALLRWIAPKVNNSSKENALQLENKPQHILPNLSGINPEIGIKRLGNNQEIYLKILQQFRDNHQNSATEIKTALESQEIETATRIAHSIKSISGSIGALALSQTAANLEKILRTGVLEQVNLELAKFETNLKEVMEAIASLFSLHSEVRDEFPPLGKGGIGGIKTEFDQQLIGKLITEMVELLETDWNEAITHLNTLKEEFKNTQFEAEIKQLEKKLNNFDIDASLKILQSLKSSLKCEQSNL